MGLKHLSQPFTCQQTIKKSRFITRLFPVQDPQEVKPLVDAVRKAEYGARHHATAMVIGPAAEHQRSNDDGEPAGSAGAPMLDVLRREGVTDTLAVVTRHFGGVLLGKAGLIRAYSGGVVQAVAGATFFTQKTQVGLTVTAAAADAGRIEHLLRGFTQTQGGGIGPITYGETTVLEIWIAPESRPDLDSWLAAHNLSGSVQELGSKLVSQPSG